MSDEVTPRDYGESEDVIPVPMPAWLRERLNTARRALGSASDAQAIADAISFIAQYAGQKLLVERDDGSQRRIDVWRGSR